MADQSTPPTSLHDSNAENADVAGAASQQDDIEHGLSRYEARKIAKIEDVEKQEKAMLSFYEQRVRTTGHGLSSWKPDVLHKTVKSHIESTWKSKLDLSLMFLSALSTLGSAVLNVWFLQDKVFDLERNKEEDYNLTQWVVSLCEAGIVSFCAFGAIWFFSRYANGGYMWKCGNCTAKQTSPAGRLDGAPNLLFSFRYLKMVGGFSFLLLIRMMTVGALKKRITFGVQMAKIGTNPQKLKEYMHPNEETRAPDGVYRRMMCCTWPLVPLTAILLFAAFCLVPAALLLKLRQIPFIYDTYVSKWDKSDWLRFFGFLNNIRGLTMRNEDMIYTAELFMFMNTNPDQEKKESQRGYFLDENGYQHYRTLMSLVTYYVRKEKGTLLTWVIMNSWASDPDKYIPILRLAHSVQE